MTKTFTLGEVLSVLLGKMLVLEHGGMYTVVRHMTSGPVYSHELCDAYAVCRPYILEAHPQLGVLDRDSVDGDNYGTWMPEKLERFGNKFELSPLPEGVYRAPTYEDVEAIYVIR
jgi:hypothetical protein